jgi:hypothetical protein
MNRQDKKEIMNLIKYKKMLGDRRMKLIDILNKIANGELKEGTKVKWDVYEYTYKKGDCYDEYLERKVDEFNYVDIIDDMALRHLNAEVELIEPYHLPDVRKMAECKHEWAEYTGYNAKTGETKHYRECVECGLQEEIEDNIAEKIEELDILEIGDSQDIDNLGLAKSIGDLNNAIREIQHKLNEVIRKLNKEVIND